MTAVARRPRRRPRPRVALAGLLLLAVACGGDDAAPSEAATPSAPAAAPGLTATIARDRLFEAQRAFEVTFVNAGDAPVVVGEARLVSALFAPLGGDARSVTVWPTGDPVSVPVPYGAAVCDAGDARLALAAVVDGTAAELELGEAPAAIRRVHAAECAAADVAATVSIGWGDTWTAVAPGRVRGTVTVEQRREGAGGVVHEVAASVVFAVQVTSPLPATSDVDVTITAARCDAHALTESKKTYRFPVFVTVGDGERVRIELEASRGPVRAALDRAIEECVAARTGH